MSPQPPIEAVFLDRDGVLNIDHGYVHDPADLEWIPGAREAVSLLIRAGVKVLVVTNQSGVARGYFDETAVHRLHRVMRDELRAVGGDITAFYHSPYHKDATVEAFRHPDHPTRKPNPGMILSGLTDHGLDASRCVLIGDNASDMEAARRAGVEGFLFPGGDLLAFMRRALGSRIPTLIENAT
ncbi:D,D-heptose 1,7-bisphosphate phosphatase [Caulobacter sp. Root655]|uniref:D-glycero-alpha-D-manno-heptose-1,7-bisphosphate 7-phosphatase n=1 Tax=Caulobacter sp. Root655 TaxID=1736578 RepID=UPI0006FD8B22|nr:HAD family hydrolase [Caulobacter sp. Root655]KRA65891.1 D,D-heptose 1,7-bisphosphate phosphatase [Caulobacter sp. Root655]